MQNSTLVYLTVLCALTIGFAYHNYSVYTGSPGKELSAPARAGQQLWQQHNCASCHQLYGLGGYLGPDLTNAASAPGKGPEYISAMLNAGPGSMPVFNFTPAEKQAMVAYLAEVDQTGYFPDHQATLRSDGWVQIRYKDEN